MAAISSNPMQQQLMLQQIKQQHPAWVDEIATPAAAATSSQMLPHDL
jgi:hypothetical protein